MTQFDELNIVFVAGAGHSVQHQKPQKDIREFRNPTLGTNSYRSGEAYLDLLKGNDFYLAKFLGKFCFNNVLSICLILVIVFLKNKVFYLINGIDIYKLLV